MAAPNKSLQTLIVLAGIAIAVSGWIWGFRHYQIASGAKFSDDEKQLFNLQDQLEQLESENTRLRTELKKLAPTDSAK